MAGKMKIKKRNITKTIILVVSISLILFLINVKAVDPEGPDDLDVMSNVTKNTTNAQMINISGGYIATLDLNATIKDTRWKAFIGNVTGMYTLDDAAGSTIYDWTISSITGRVYATRNDTSVTWASINCSNISDLEDENYKMNHTLSEDNLTATFNATYDSVYNRTVSGSHNPFWVGNVYIYSNTCPTLNTYTNSIAQDIEFEEMSLFDGISMVYATILEPDQVGYNGYTYDFQMIVPENGVPGFGSSTAYYIYVEIGT